MTLTVIDGGNGKPEQLPQPAHESVEVCGVLESYLELARRGEIHSVGIVGIDDEGLVRCAACSSSAHTSALVDALRGLTIDLRDGAVGLEL